MIGALTRTDIVHAAGTYTAISCRMRAATQNDLDHAGVAQPEDVIALIEYAPPPASSPIRNLYTLFAALAFVVTVTISAI